LQVDVPGQRIGKAHGDAARRLALPGGQRQLRQAHLAQVTLERAGQGKCSCRAVEITVEGALVVAILVLNLGTETLEGNLRRRFQRV